MREQLLAALKARLVSVWQRILSVTPEDHPNRAGYLSNLRTALGTRFDRTGAQTDLDEAIGVGRAAVSATPEDHPDRAKIGRAHV